MIRTLLKIPVLMTMVVLLVSGTAMALPTLSVSDGTNTAIVQDLDGDGVVFYNSLVDPANTFAGSNLAFNMTTGLTKPILGMENDPGMHLDSVSLTSMGAATLTIAFTETGFMADNTDPVAFLTGFGGTTAGEVTLTAYLDETNAAFGTGTLIGQIDPLTGVAFSDSDYWVSALTANSPYSLTLVATITHSAGGAQVTSFDADLSSPVPEPATMLLLGTGLAGIATARRRRSKKA